MNIKNTTRESYKYFRYLYNYYLSLNSRVSILLYHRILPDFDSNPFGTFVSLDKFEYQISYIKEKYNIISLSDLFNIIKDNKLPNDHKIVITFDDGYIDNYEYAYPLLKKYLVPATFFLLPYYVNNNEPVWDWKLYKIIYESNNIENLKDLDLLGHNLTKNRKELLWKLVNYFKYKKPEIRNEYIKKISNNLIVHNFDYIKNRSMNWNEIKEMSSDLISFGSHGCSHTSLLNQDNNFVDDELLKSKQIIENKLQKECNFFSFPFGSRYDFSKNLINKVFNIYDICLLNIDGSNKIRNNTFFFNRIIMHDKTNLKYLF